MRKHFHTQFTLYIIIFNMRILHFLAAIFFHNANVQKFLEAVLNKKDITQK